MKASEAKATSLLARVSPLRIQINQMIAEAAQKRNENMSCVISLPMGRYLREEIECEAVKLRKDGYRVRTVFLTNVNEMYIDWS